MDFIAEIMIKAKLVDVMHLVPGTSNHELSTENNIKCFNYRTSNRLKVHYPIIT